MNFDFNNTLGVGLRVFALFIPIIVKVIAGIGLLFFLTNYVFVN